MSADEPGPVTADDPGADDATRLGRAIGARLRRPGPRRARPPLLNSIASSAARFARATARPPDVRRSLAGPAVARVPSLSGAEIRPPRWWTPQVTATAPEQPLPPRGLPTVVRRVPSEQTWSPGGMSVSLVGRVVPVRRIEEVVAAGPMLTSHDRARLAAPRRAATTPTTRESVTLPTQATTAAPGQQPPAAAPRHEPPAAAPRHEPPAAAPRHEPTAPGHHGSTGPPRSSEPSPTVQRTAIAPPAPGTGEATGPGALGGGGTAPVPAGTSGTATSSSAPSSPSPLSGATPSGATPVGTTPSGPPVSGTTPSAATPTDRPEHISRHAVPVPAPRAASRPAGVRFTPSGMPAPRLAASLLRRRVERIEQAAAVAPGVAAIREFRAPGVRARRIGRALAGVAHPFPRRRPRSDRSRRRRPERAVRSPDRHGFAGCGRTAPELELRLHARAGDHRASRHRAPSRRPAFRRRADRRSAGHLRAGRPPAGHRRSPPARGHR